MYLYTKMLCVSFIYININFVNINIFVMLLLFLDAKLFENVAGSVPLPEQCLPHSSPRGPCVWSMKSHSALEKPAGWQRAGPEQAVTAQQAVWARRGWGSTEERQQVLPTGVWADFPEQGCLSWAFQAAGHGLAGVGLARKQT